MAAVLALLLLAFVVVGGPGRPGSPLLGDVAPPISGEPIRGRAPDVATWRGGWTLVNFAAPWCTDCLVEHPELLALARSSDVDIVTVIVESTRREAEAFLDARPHPWAAVFDPEGRTQVAYGVTGVPESYLVAPNGRVAAKFVGAITAELIRGAVSDRRR